MNRKFSKMYLPIKHFNNVCRVCLSESQVLVPINEINFSHCLNLMGSVENVNLITVFMKFCNIEVTNSDSKPEKICEFCINMGCKAFNFFQLFLCSNEFLESKLQEHKEKSTRVVKTKKKRSVLEQDELQNTDGASGTFSIVENTHENINSECYTTETNPDSYVCNLNYQNDCIKEVTNVFDNQTLCFDGTNNAKEYRLLDHDYCTNSEEIPKINLAQLLQSVKLKLNPDKVKGSPLSKNEILQIGYAKDVFTCKFCKIKFSGIEKVIEHAKSKHPNETMCLLCSKRYKQPWRYIYHVANHSSKAAVCHTCFLYFETQEELDTHKNSIKHANGACHLCNKHYGKTKGATEKLRMHIDAVHHKIRQHQCQICGKAFLYNANMKRHIRTAHFKESKFLCQYCAKSYTTHHILKTHMQRKHGVEFGLNLSRKTESNESEEQWIFCQYCAKKFKSSHYFYKHSEIHPEFKDYKCVVCELEFASLTKLRDHQKEHQQYDCLKCDERFISKHDLLQHKRNHRHKSLFKEKLVKCEYCPKVCTNTYRFYVHSGLHPKFKNYKCEICQLVFDRLKKLKFHQNIHKNFVCPKCGKKFVSQLALSAHKYTHTHVQRCNLCDTQILGGKKALEFHMNIHTDTRPYVCDTCGKGFKQVAHLKIHMSQHGAEKPWKCKLCDKKFHFQSMLKQHMRSHTGEKPYRCLYCEKVFRDTTIRHKHIFKFHPEKSSEFQLYRKNHLRNEIREVEKHYSISDIESESSENTDN